ncbi:hypothetical protein BDI4_1320005 [Burkholderia diffusa]|nr:hypothetical protein BDI4_1320005 [Burkholderia diffusa]
MRGLSRFRRRRQAARGGADERQFDAASGRCAQPAGRDARRHRRAEVRRLREPPADAGFRAHAERRRTRTARELPARDVGRPARERHASRREGHASVSRATKRGVAREAAGFRPRACVTPRSSLSGGASVAAAPSAATATSAAARAAIPAHAGALRHAATRRRTSGRQHQHQRREQRRGQSCGTHFTLLSPRRPRGRAVRVNRRPRDDETFPAGGLFHAFCVRHKAKRSGARVRTRTPPGRGAPPADSLRHGMRSRNAAVAAASGQR